MTFRDVETGPDESKTLLGVAYVYGESIDEDQLIASVEFGSSCSCPTCLHRSATMFVLAALQIAEDIEADFKTIWEKAESLRNSRGSGAHHLN